MLAGFFPLDEATKDDWCARLPALCLGSRRTRADLAPARRRRYAALLKETARGASATRTIFSFYSRRCRLSSPPVAMVDGLLCIDPKRRWGVHDALRHTWMCSRA